MKATFELQPCPFCGGDAEPRANGIGDHYVICTCCGAASSDIQCESPEHAADRWNRRDQFNRGKNWSDEA